MSPAASSLSTRPLPAEPGLAASPALPLSPLAGTPHTRPQQPTALLPSLAACDVRVRSRIASQRGPDRSPPARPHGSACLTPRLESGTLLVGVWEPLPSRTRPANMALSGEAAGEEGDGALAGTAGWTAAGCDRPNRRRNASSEGAPALARPSSLSTVPRPSAPSVLFGLYYGRPRARRCAANLTGPHERPGGLRTAPTGAEDSHLVRSEQQDERKGGEERRLLRAASWLSLVWIEAPDRSI
jgi:hypothetical protein